EIYDALAEQTLVVPGTEASALIVPVLAAQLAAAHAQRQATEQEIAALLEAFPPFPPPDVPARHGRQDHGRGDRRDR
ncbi:hypothetical protein GA0115254_1284234, partial [Streptomyces sp. Ncost-T10-10d]